MDLPVIIRSPSALLSSSVSTSRSTLAWVREDLRYEWKQSWTNSSDRRNGAVVAAMGQVVSNLYSHPTDQVVGSKNLFRVSRPLPRAVNGERISNPFDRRNLRAYPSIGLIAALWYSKSLQVQCHAGFPGLGFFAPVNPQSGLEGHLLVFKRKFRDFRFMMRLLVRTHPQASRCRTDYPWLILEFKLCLSLPLMRLPVIRVSHITN